MPAYDYQCEEGHTFEVVQSVKDPKLTQCPIWVEAEEPRQCNSPTKRLLGAPAFILKGSGWYKDGYSSSGQGKPKKKPKKEE